MEVYRIENLSFTYPGKDKPALRDINLIINSGEFVTVCGKSGSGKSTLLRQLKPLLSPAGEKNGGVFFCGNSIDTVSKREQCEKIGFVMQNPESQTVTDKVWHELAFGLESLGMPDNEIRARVAETASFLGIEKWFYRETAKLSGGQRQLLNLASALVMQPSVIILDEPTGQLDPIAASDFLTILKKINNETGMTVIITEHRLEDVFAISDKVVIMDEGKIISCGTPSETAAAVKNHNMFFSLPTAAKVFLSLDGDGNCPITVREGKAWLDEKSCEPHMPEIKEYEEKEEVIRAEKLWFRYEKNSEDILKGLSLTVRRGEIYAINGGNGTGKTTALSVIGGLKKAYQGTVTISGGRIGILPQNPQTLFVKKTLREDLYDVFDDGLTMQEKTERISKVCSLCGIGSLLDFHPYDISGGEQQRAALAKLLLREPDILFLDEPTKGLDGFYKRRLANLLMQLKSGGVTMVIVSHDVEFCAEYADRCGLFFDGQIVSEGTPREFFAGKNFYTTAANRMAREKLPYAVTASDITEAYGGKMPEIKDDTPSDDFFYGPNPKSGKKPLIERQAKTEKNKKKTLSALLTVFFAVPLTIFFGMYFLGDRKYYFISLMIILEIMLPFAMIFEGRRPKAREISVIAVMCAAAVAGRAAFYAFPQVKPVSALLIITGMCLGAEAGFLTGALTAFVSNMFFGQGPWTPWQMFAFGMVGFLAGALCEKGLLGKTKTGVCIFGGITVLLVYGGIMNASSVLMWQSTPTWEMFAAAYLSGLPFDVIHAVSTAVFLWIAVRPFTEKLERIKTKYDLYG